MKPLDVMTLRRIVTEIQDELGKLNQLFQEWESHRFQEWTDTFFLRGKASVFHDFYCAAENIFKRIAPTLNGGVPEGPGWHKQLLYHMSLAIPEVRPAVVSKETAGLLDEFLDFRHKFRHIYGFDLDFKKMDAIERIYPETHRKFCEDIEKFIAFLERLIAEIETKS
jgi:hypothetical protein